MNFLELFAGLAFLVYFVLMTVGSVLAAPVLWLAFRSDDPVARARGIALGRLLPSGLGLAFVFGLFLPAFLRYEPWQTEESAGLTLALLAILSASVVAAGFLRGALSLWSTGRLVRGWSPKTTPIDVRGIDVPACVVEEAFPLVSLVGCFRPKLFVARSVLERCDENELGAVVAHEAGHLRRGDPWMRLLLRSCPDLLGVTRFGRSMEKAWAEAAEQAADDQACRRGPQASLDLASALLKVTRLAGGNEARALPVTTFFRGEGVAQRIARLLEPGAADSPSHERVRFVSVGAVLSAGLVLSCGGALSLLPRVYDLCEWAVRSLP